ncbi:MAG: hypothetical protein AB1611_12880 [bacterium]
MKRKSLIVLSSLLGVIILLFQGCGDSNMFDGISDDSGEAARMEDIRKNLNSGNFDGVIAALGSKASLTDQERRYLASAYVGKAGFDTLKLLEEIAKEDESGNDVEIYDAIAGIFGKNMDEGQLTSKVDLIGKALAVLGAPNTNNRSRYRSEGFTANDDIRLQRGIYAAIHAILSISLSIAQEYDLGPVIPLTIDEMKTALAAKQPPITKIDLTAVPPGLNQDLWLVKDGVEALSGGKLIGTDEVNDNSKNDIDREFSKFLNDLGFLQKDPATPADPETGSVTGNELSKYLNHLLWPQSYSL